MSASAQVDAAVSSGLRERVEALRTAGWATAGGDELLAVSALPRFYEERAFASAWSARGASRGLDELMTAIRGSVRHGLDPAAYHLPALDSLRAHVRMDPASAASAMLDLDLLATDAFLVLGSHLLHGRVNPETLDPEWLANRRSARMELVLADALDGDGVGAALDALAPAQRRYQRMLEAADELREIEARGGWPPVPDGQALERGSEGSRVAVLRARLGTGGDLQEGEPGGAASNEEFDETVDVAVRRFQARHGLEVDGVVGRSTLAALNVPVAERIRQVEINLERWRWLPEDLGSRHIEVNVPGFEARLVDQGRIVSQHRAVVGRPYRETPMFSGTMTYLVLSPYWHVPPTIAQVDKLPQFRADPGQVAAQRMTLLDAETNLPVDPYAIDWTMTGTEFNRRFRLRQDPGPNNALGSVKFMFPNRHNVYLHDTPSRDLFERTARDFSSGCIRVDRALDLAQMLLADQPEWSRARIEQTVASGTERAVRLDRPVPVHLLYWTAWNEDGDVLHFRNDIYGRDALVWRALTADPPVQ